MKRAVERHSRGEARVIPVILRHVHWQRSPFGKIQALPTDGIPVTDPIWHRLDIAFYNVAEGIRVVAETLAEKKEAEKREMEAKSLAEERAKQLAEEEHSQLKRAFEDAYTSDNDQAILTAYNTIQHSSNRPSFSFSSDALRRIDLARQREQTRQQPGKPFFPRLRSSKWIKENGVKTTAAIVSLQTDFVPLHPSDYLQTDYIAIAEGNNPVSGKRDRFYFDGLHHDVFNRLREGQEVAIYIHPKIASQYILDA